MSKEVKRTTGHLGVCKVNASSVPANGSPYPQMAQILQANGCPFPILSPPKKDQTREGPFQKIFS